jgi:hypothetical protein
MDSFKPLNNQSGIVLVGTILVLAAITVLGITLTKISSNEMYMATNEKCKEAARYSSESAAISSAKLIRLVSDLDQQGTIGVAEGSPLAQGIQYPPQAGSDSPQVEFYKKVIGIDTSQTCEDVNLTPAGLDTQTDIRSQGAESVAGSRANEFASGYTQGVGVGSTTGGTALYFIVASRGGSCDNARHVVYTRYRKVLGVAGGM